MGGRRKEGEEGRAKRNLGGAPEVEAGRGDDKEEAIRDLQVDDAIEVEDGGGGGVRRRRRLEGYDLRPSVGHVHLGDLLLVVVVVVAHLLLRQLFRSRSDLNATN